MSVFSCRITSVFLFCGLMTTLIGQPDTILVSQQLYSGGVVGSIHDVVTGEPLPFVNIRLVGSAKGTVSESDGSFQFNELETGKHTLIFSFLGYEDKIVEEVSVSPQALTQLDVELEPMTFNTEEVVITASLRPQAVKMAPASIALIGSKELRAKNITTFDQAFDEVPGVIVTRSSGANVQAFSIRGASEVAGGGIGNRVLLLIDGRPAISPESGGALWNLVPLNSIERIEVVKGAYSSLYGSSAMGGVVNVITRRPSTEPATRVHLNYGFFDGAPASSGYNRYNDFNTVEISHSRKVGKMAYLIDAGRKSNDGHREKSAFELYNFFGKASWQFSKNRYIQLSSNLNWIHNDTPATWFSTRRAYSVAEHRKDDYQNRREFNADLYYYALPNKNLKYSSRFFYYNSFSRFSFNDDPGNDSTNVNFGKQLIDESTVSTQRLGNVTQVDLYTDSDHYIIAGTDIKWDHVVGLPDTVLYGRHQAISLGAYVQDEITFSKQFIATLGIRFDYYNILGEFNESNISPKIAMVYRPSSKLSVRMLLAQAFRNPAMAERFIKFEQGGGLRFRPNPNLKSERLKLSAELGTKLDISKKASLDVALFYNRYNNLISFRQLSRPLEPLLYEVINLKEALLQGFELTFQQAWGDFLNFRAGYTYLDARDISPERLNDELPYKVRHSFSLSASATVKDFIVNVNSRYRSAIKEVFIYPGNEPDAMFLINSKITYQLKDKHNLYLAVDNIFNAQYEELERYRMPGRAYSLGMVLNL